MNQQIDQINQIKNNLSNIKHIIVVLSGKGGVGKSTVSTNLALLFASKKKQVGLLDCDFHGPSIPTMLGLKQKTIQHSPKGFLPIQATVYLKVLSIDFLSGNQDNPIIWRGPMKMGAIRQILSEFYWGSLDYLIIDLPPGTGDEPLTIAQFLPKNAGVIIVTTPQEVALASVRKSINFVKKLHMQIIGIIENMSGFICPHCNKQVNIFKQGGGKKAAETYQIPYLGSIPLDPTIVEKSDKGSLKIEKGSVIETSFTSIINEIEKNNG